MRTYASYGLLLAVKAVSRAFYRHEIRWVGRPPVDPWRDLRLVAFLHHTSLFEPLFAGAAPNRFLWRIAHHAVLPAADKTIDRPLVGRFFRLLAPHVVPITRRPDETWQAVLSRIEADSMVVILPEGRMQRKNGLDAEGRPMSVRGGIADILRAIPAGPMLVAYSGGLHHVQAPGELLPRPFRTLRIALEHLEIESYRSALMEQAGEEGFKEAVKRDLERRTELYRPR